MSSQALALAEDKMPAHLKKVEGTGRGNENVGQHLAIPRIKLLQKMSDEVDKHSPGYIKGAEAGDFINTLTNHVYGEEMYVLSLTFKNEFVVWRKREAGAGLLGNYASHVEAQEAINATDKPEDYDIVETHTHLLLIKDPETGELEPSPAIMDFASSKLRISRNWNSQIGMKGGDRFAGLWKLRSQAVENRMGNAFMNLDVEFVGWAQKEDYDAAERFYEQHSGN
jgi:hypothetical protein